MDDLLLRVIRHATQGATLRDIIAVGDYLDHSIFTVEELREGLARLLAAGQVMQKKGRWVIGKGKGTVPSAQDIKAAIADYLKK